MLRIVQTVASEFANADKIVGDDALVVQNRVVSFDVIVVCSNGAIIRDSITVIF